MRRYQLGGLEHIHMLKHVPRSYDMTRTHILHKGVNKHVDVVLRCSPKYFKKKKVAVSVVMSDKKTAAARIRANAMRGYVAVRKTVNEQFEKDRRAAADAFEIRYGARNPGLDSLIHDMRSQLAAMAKKSSAYIDSQLGNHTADGAVPESAATTAEPIISPETEEILRRGGYRVPNRQPPEDPYSVEHMTQASDEEFHNLMNSLERSLDEVCRKYAVPPVEEEEPEETKAPATPPVTTYSGYSFPTRRSLSVTKRQEIVEESPAKEVPIYQYPDDSDGFKPAISFKQGGGHYIPEDELFDRELTRPEETYVPPAYLFDDDADSVDDSEETVAFPFIPDEETPREPSGEQEEESAVSPEDYVQQQIFFPTEPQDSTAGQGQYPPEEEDFADPTLYSDTNGPHEEPVSGFSPDSGDIFGGYDDANTYTEPFPEPYETENPDGQDDGDAFPVPGETQNPDGQDDRSAFPVPGQTENTDGQDGGDVFPMPGETENPDGQDGGDVFPMPGETENPDGQDGGDAFPVPGETQNTDGQDDGSPVDEDAPPPLLFPDDEENLPPPFIFPDDEEEGYQPAPVSPDRNDFSGDTAGSVMNRSGQTLFSRTGDQIKKVIGVIHGKGEADTRSQADGQPPVNSNVEITYSDSDDD